MMKNSSYEKLKTKVLYAGYLPPFGLIGSHPQFEHLGSPPPGYEFEYIDAGRFALLFRLLALPVNWLSSPGSIRSKLKTLIGFVRNRTIGSELQQCYKSAGPLPGNNVAYNGWGDLWGTIRNLLVAVRRLRSSAIRNGAKQSAIMSFILTRDVLSQLRIPTSARLALLPTSPFILGQVPWVIEIEDPTTLFRPFLRNGQTSSLEIHDIACYPIIKTILESENCRGIICHMKSTAESIPILFNNPALREKTFHIPLGITLPETTASSDKQENGEIRILFTNSWHQGYRGFYYRGGLDVLKAFSILAAKYSNIRLILRTKLPHDLDERYRDIIKDCPVEIMDRFLTNDDMEKLLSTVDIYLLPSARIHIVSLLKAMSYGLAVVASDGWGMTEYVEHGRNGLVVRGRYGKSSWMSERGMLMENYESLFSVDTFVVNELVDTLSTLIEDRNLRKRLGKAARRDIETRFSRDSWNRGLAKVFDKVLS